MRRRRLGEKPALIRDERIVAWASTSEGAVVATNLGLWLPGRKERLGWHQIHRAVWSDPALTVVPAVEVGAGAGYLVMADDDPVELTLTDPDKLPVQVRERVTRSVVYTAHHDLPDGGVRVVGRKVPGVDGLTWHVRYDPGTDADDPEVAAATTALLPDSA